MTSATLRDNLTGRSWDLAKLVEEVEMSDEEEILMGRIGSGCQIEIGEMNSKEETGRKTLLNISAQEATNGLVRGLTKQISGKHAKLRYMNGFNGRGYYIIDAPSLNGTTVGKTKAVEWTNLFDGDEIFLGSYGPLVFKVGK